MKKLIMHFIITSNIFYTHTCNINNNLIKEKEIKPPFIENKDITYYQNLILAIEKDSKECQQLIKEIKLNKNNFQNKEDYQSSLDELDSQLANYKARIYEYKYQILLLSINKIFSDKQKQLAQELLINKIKYLKKELEIKIKYLDYYGNHKIKIIKNEIKATELILQNFINKKGN